MTASCESTEQPSDGLIVNNVTKTDDFTLKRGDGIPAQGNENPQAVFTNHAVVLYGGKWYDPSYGTPVQSSLLGWEDLNLGGLIMSFKIRSELTGFPGKPIPLEKPVDYNIPHEKGKAQLKDSDAE